MSERAALRGELSEQGGPIEVLRAAEERRLSGRLRFRLPDGSWGEIRLLGGEPLEEQDPLADGRDPLEAFLSLGQGDFELRAELPPLPVSRGDARRREGSLAVHVPADLMRYCERVGLTGRLRLEQGGRHAEVLYDRGELVGIQVDGRDDDDLHAVFGWEEGRFVVEACDRPPCLPQEEPAPDEEPDPPQVPPGPAERGEATGRFLRVVEVELARIVEERERRRPASRSSPEGTLPPPSRRAGSNPPAGSERREPTVRIVYLRAPEETPAEEEPSTTRHLSGGEQVDALPEARPERQGPAAAGEGPAARTASPAAALGWALVVLALILGAVALLSRLPPMR